MEKAKLYSWSEAFWEPFLVKVGGVEPLVGREGQVSAKEDEWEGFMANCSHGTSPSLVGEKGSSSLIKKALILTVQPKCLVLHLEGLMRSHYGLLLIWKLESRNLFYSKRKQRLLLTHMVWDNHEQRNFPSKAE